MTSFRKYFFPIIFCVLLSSAFSQDIHHNPWELIIYRPENGGSINDVRCFLVIKDKNGKNVTESAVKASYEWVSIPGRKYPYRKKLFLSGGMAMHLNIKPGKYDFSFYTPKESQYPYSFPQKDTWESNVFSYDTQNPVKVIFVVPTADENGFYNGGWYIDYRCPPWFKFTKPARTSDSTDTSENTD